jgi:hypothetical protein
MLTTSKARIFTENSRRKQNIILLHFLVVSFPLIKPLLPDAVEETTVIILISALKCKTGLCTARTELLY